MIRWSPPGSALYRLEQGDDAKWTTDAQLLATIADALHDLQWLTARLHGGKGQQPERIPRPGVKQRSNSADKHIGSDPIPAGEFHEWWTKGYRNA